MGQPNVDFSRFKYCECGKCNELISIKDSQNRFRRFKKGHYNKGKDFSGQNNPNWKGGKYKDSNGYILIYNPQHPYCNNDGYVYEHRLVMEKYIDRNLTNKEVVHHIDKNRQNNSINNLELFEDNGKHLMYELKGEKLCLM